VAFVAGSGRGLRPGRLDLVGGDRLGAVAAGLAEGLVDFVISPRRIDSKSTSSSATSCAVHWGPACRVTDQLLLGDLAAGRRRRSPPCGAARWSTLRAGLEGGAAEPLGEPDELLGQLREDDLADGAGADVLVGQVDVLDVDQGDALAVLHPDVRVLEGAGLAGVPLDVPGEGLHLGLALAGLVVAAHLVDAVLEVAEDPGELAGEVHRRALAAVLHLRRRPRGRARSRRRPPRRRR
jgi:hypothetical protein